MINWLKLLSRDNWVVSSLSQVKLIWVFLTMKFDIHMHVFLLGMHLEVELFSDKINLLNWDPPNGGGPSGWATLQI